jgi:hypothetical protein
MNYTKSSVIFLNGRWINATDAMGDLRGPALPSVNGVFDGLRAYGAVPALKYSKPGSTSSGFCTPHQICPSN